MPEHYDTRPLTIHREEPLSHLHLPHTDRITDPIATIVIGPRAGRQWRRSRPSTAAGTVLAGRAGGA